jgi:prevent-host-death family protein
MTVVTIHQAKTNLSKLIAEVEAGGEVVIARGKTPVVKLSPADPPRPKRVFGSMKGQISIDERFFEPLPDDELALWNGEGD